MESRGHGSYSPFPPLTAHDMSDRKQIALAEASLCIDAKGGPTKAFGDNARPTVKQVGEQWAAFAKNPPVIDRSLGIADLELLALHSQFNNFEEMVAATTPEEAMKTAAFRNYLRGL